ncbi:hypothetical protein RRF57_004903 [Xylaria bambusicola]|uniref:Uncharacterized protein n=1 Tax=Xylaria bambusicola TaxID=326684 RepID=A0AAN7UH46_9PEZI
MAGVDIRTVARILAVVDRVFTLKIGIHPDSSFSDRVWRHWFGEEIDVHPKLPFAARAWHHWCEEASVNLGLSFAARVWHHWGGQETSAAPGVPTDPLTGDLTSSLAVILAVRHDGVEPVNICID